MAPALDMEAERAIYPVAGTTTYYAADSLCQSLFSSLAVNRFHLEVISLIIGCALGQNDI